MDKIVKVPLNLHEVTMAKPKNCILNYYKGIRSPQDAEPYVRYCEDCAYCHGDQCVYKKYTVEIACGNFEEDNREYHYVQFCCGNCGELIKLEDKISYIYHTLSQETQYCKYCKTPHKCLSSEKDVYTFAIPVKKE
jgi:hypothetical protein